MRKKLTEAIERQESTVETLRNLANIAQDTFKDAENELKALKKTARLAERRLDRIWHEQADSDAIRAAHAESVDAWNEYNDAVHQHQTRGDD